MPLNKQSGNMYDWVTHTWNPIRGCKHDCKYCYVKSLRNYDMTPRLVEKELKTNLGEGKVIFVGSTADMFGEFIPIEWISRVLSVCRKYPNNEYLFQTKNPNMFWKFVGEFPPNKTIGTTIETNRDYQLSKAPTVHSRAYAMQHMNYSTFKRMVTIEPILDFDVGALVWLIRACKPDWVNIGADSKGHNLPEPDKEKVEKLLKILAEDGIDIRIKSNLRRLQSGRS